MKKLILSIFIASIYSETGDGQGLRSRLLG